MLIEFQNKSSIFFSLDKTNLLNLAGQMVPELKTYFPTLLTARMANVTKIWPKECV